MSAIAFYSLVLEVESMVSQSISSLSGLVLVVYHEAVAAGVPKVMSGAERFNDLTTSPWMGTGPIA